MNIDMLHCDAYERSCVHPLEEQKVMDFRDGDNNHYESIVNMAESDPVYDCIS